MPQDCQVIIRDATRAFDQAFTYRIPETLAGKVAVGCLVEVPLGPSNRPVAAFVVALGAPAAADFAVKEVLSLLSDRPLLLPDQIELAEQMRNHWLCSRAEALRLMVPAAVSQIGDRTSLVAELLDPAEAASRLDSGEISRLGQQKVIELLLDSEVAPVTEIMGACHVSRSVVMTLAKNGWLKLYRRRIERPELYPDEPVWRKAHIPTAAQQTAIGRIVEQLDRPQNGDEEKIREFLLYGVTGSGKTEVYLQAARAAVDRGLGVIILVPEIALTPQMISRIRSRFGSDIAVLHSRLTPAQRYEQWQRILRGEVMIVIGARSAVFAPLKQIGLIVIDEEQESSYKSEKHPRYHARAVARMRAGQHNSVLVLGSATPSVETFVRTEHQVSELMSLPERIGTWGLARTEIVDMRKELIEGNRSVFSRLLQDELHQAFAAGHQAMILINRRGFSGFVLCRQCGHLIRCASCSVSMTVHSRPIAGENRTLDQLICHYCGRIKPLPQRCPECGSDKIGRFGSGTQQVEKAFNRLFAPARALRMDQDTTVSRSAHEKILTLFEQRQADVLIGTQMIAKGHDFPNVTAVGILSADLMLGLSDFRASERAFQLITQAAGRAGRGDAAGTVVIQAYNIDDYAIRFAARQDFMGFYRQEIAYRRRMQYPPFGTVCLITLTAWSDEKAREHVEELQRRCVKRKEESAEFSRILILGASRSPLQRLRNRYRYRLVLKGPGNNLLASFLRPIVDHKPGGDVTMAVDFNPYQML